MILLLLFIDLDWEDAPEKKRERRGSWEQYTKEAELEKVRETQESQKYHGKKVKEQDCVFSFFDLFKL